MFSSRKYHAIQTHRERAWNKSVADVSRGISDGHLPSPYPLNFPYFQWLTRVISLSVNANSTHSSTEVIVSNSIHLLQLFQNMSETPRRIILRIV